MKFLFIYLFILEQNKVLVTSQSQLSWRPEHECYMLLFFQLTDY